MDALEKSIDRGIAVRDAAYDQVLQVKAGGAVGDIASPSMGSAFDASGNQAKYRGRYELFRGWTYSAVNALAMEAANQPVNLARMKGSTVREGERRNLDTTMYLKSKMPKRFRGKASNQELEIIEDHTLKDALERPCDYQSRWAFVYDFVANLNLTGWAFIVAGEVEGKLQLAVLPTTWVTPVHEKGPFSSFKVKNPRAVGVEPKELSRDQVAFAHLPNPSDPLSALAPTGTQISAVRIDDHMQASQERFFENGIFPSVIITAGKSPYSDTGGRPVLQGKQWRQIQGAINKKHRGWANYGSPVILDGLIEKVDRWSATQNEMGWEKTEDKIRTRILSAFAVHPYILSDAAASPGHAQVTNIEKRFFARVNTFLGMLSNVMTNFLGGYEGDEKLLIWWDELVAIDPQLREKALSEGRKNGDISQNEWRAEHGFPPDEDNNQAIIHPGIGQNVNAIVTAAAGGTIQREPAIATLEAYGIPTERAELMIGEGPPPEEQQQQIEQEQEQMEEVVARMGEALIELKKPVQVEVNDERVAEMIEKTLDASSASSLDDVSEKIGDLMDRMIAFDVRLNDEKIERECDAKLLSEKNKTLAVQLTSGMKEAVLRLKASDDGERREDGRAELVRSVLTELSDKVTESFDTLQRAAEQPIEVNVVNEVKTPEVNVTNEVSPASVEVTNEVKTPEVKVVNKVGVPEVKVESPNVTVNPPTVKVAGPTVNVKSPQVKVEPKIDVEVPKTEVNVEVTREGAPKRAIVSHPDGKISRVELKE